MAARARNAPLGFWLATAAVVGALGFTVWALVAPVYASGATIFEANPEFTVRVALATPLVVASMVWLLLHVACRFDATWARQIASAVAYLLVAFAVVSAWSIGMFVMPVALLLVAAASLTPVAHA